MDNIIPSSPASSSASDSDAFNTESAHVYFGPFKTPERKFIAASRTLFPPPQPTAVRRSPRLSSPRLRSASPMDVQATEEDIRDTEQVAQLVNDSDEDEGEPSGSGMGTPLAGDDNFPDEPSSALADRVIHALDNPSPPPSPPSTLRIFDPFHTTNPDGPTDYHTDLMSLKINDNSDTGSGITLLSASVESQYSSQFTAPPPDILINDAHATRECLISFECSPIFPIKQGATKAAFSETMTPPNRPVFSVDELLSQTPHNPPIPTPNNSGQTLGNMNGEPSPKDKSSMLPRQGSTPEVVITTPPVTEQSDLHNNMTDIVPDTTQSTSTERLAATPLRRSTRPRRSITPSPTPDSNPSIFVAPPSIARTQVKKKMTALIHDDEIVNDSQDEQDDIRKSPSLLNTESTIRVRHRSPGKAPLSFRRELGSLSPTSSNVLSTLAFAAVDDPVNENAITMPLTQIASSSSQPMFSFSVFTPPTEVPSTPARPTGPVRFVSPPKASSSSSTYRIQTPALGDPTNTPARRIPISQAVAQGHVSPEKAIQLGFTASGTPLPSTSSPAKRVLLSDSAAPALMKSSNLRPASPIKRTLGLKSTSVELGQRFTASLKGKERAPPVSQERTAALPKLPYPLLSSTSASSSQPVSSQDVIHVKPSPAKSALKQPTSKIPRIGMKPYARTVPKVSEKAAATASTTNLARPLPNSVASVSVAQKNAREGAKMLPASSSSRAKPSASVSTSLTTTLKRKRDGEMLSPAKPRVIMLRQVPPLATPPIETLSITQPPAPASTASVKVKKPTQAPVRIRRVMDVEPIISVKPTPPQKPLPQSDAELAIDTTSQQISETPSVLTVPVSSPSTEIKEIPPGSPMKQDPEQNLQKAPEQPSDDAATPRTVDDATGAASSVSGLRRTTRSRRSATLHDVFTEGSSRPTTTRRKAPAFRSDDIFSGMSMTALKDLTVSNTVKNQRYVAAKLEMEVIRKEGTRPESPAVKIRTIVQRQQEERERERAERANRRARRSGEDLPSSDIEDPNSVAYSDDPMSMDEDGDSPIRHARGAGESDDYETPDKYKTIKPMRLFGPNGEVTDGAQMRRRVKWDRGLFTSVYLDEVKLGTRQTSKENRALKSILAPTAKALRLDTLGNHPHADTPLSDIVQENVTVKKIVYDSDVAVAEIVAAPKNTRSKSKKKQ